MLSKDDMNSSSEEPKTWPSGPERLEEEAIHGVYADHAATSPLLPEAKQAMLDAWDNYPGHASALHTPGHTAHNLIEEARAAIAQLINADPCEIIFTSGGSESNNTVINIFAGQSVAVSATEHPSILEPARTRCQVTELPADKWGVVLGDCFGSFRETEHKSPLAAATYIPDGAQRPAYDVPNAKGVSEKDPKKSPKLTSIMLANNELGTSNNIQPLAAAAHRHGAFFHTDATQALGKIPINVKKLDVDYMTISAHKIGGPVGIGALYVKQGAPFTPFIIGGHQEHGRRAGTYATAQIAGFGAAAQYALDHNTPQQYKEKVAPLRNKLARRILAEIPYSSINTPKQALPNILNVSFQAAEGESIQLYLDAKADIIVSTGSACASGDGKPSHVIMATHNDAEVAHSSIRFSLGLNTTEQDINQIMQELPDIVKYLQQISTIKPREEPS